MAEKPKETPEKGKRGRSTLVIVIAAVALGMAAAGAGAAWYLRGSPPTAADEVIATSDTPGVFLDVEPFTVNLAGSDGDRFAQVAVILEIVDASSTERIRADLPRLRNDVLLQISSRSAAELLSVEGKQALATEVQRLAARSAGWSPDLGRRPNPVTAVHYSKFIVQ